MVFMVFSCMLLLVVSFTLHSYTFYSMGCHFVFSFLMEGESHSISHQLHTRKVRHEDVTMNKEVKHRSSLGVSLGSVFHNHKQ